VLRLSERRLLGRVETLAYRLRDVVCSAASLADATAEQDGVEIEATALDLQIERKCRRMHDAKTRQVPVDRDLPLRVLRNCGLETRQTRYANVVVGRRC
jgi:hypothetical protein